MMQNVNSDIFSLSIITLEQQGYFPEHLQLYSTLKQVFKNFYGLNISYYEKKKPLFLYLLHFQNTRIVELCYFNRGDH